MQEQCKCGCLTFEIFGDKVKCAACEKEYHFNVLCKDEQDQIHTVDAKIILL